MPEVRPYWVAVYDLEDEKKYADRDGNGKDAIQTLTLDQLEAWLTGELAELVNIKESAIFVQGERAAYERLLAQVQALKVTR